MAEEPKTPPAQETPKAEAEKAPVVPLEEKLYADSKEAPAKAAPPPEKPVVPEKYELKKPDGSLLGDKAVETISSYAKEKGLSNEQAQSLLERESSAVKSFFEEQQTKHNQQVDAWVGEVKADKEIGGEGYKQNVELASRVIKRFGSESLVKQLNETGFGNHPELVRVFARIGKSMTSDQLVVGGGTPAPKREMADRFYGSTTSKEN